MKKCRDCDVDAPYYKMRCAECAVKRHKEVAREGGQRRDAKKFAEWRDLPRPSTCQARGCSNDLVSREGSKSGSGTFRLFCGPTCQKRDLRDRQKNGS